MQLQDQDSVTAMLGSVISILDHLTNARTQHLLLMKSSARYLERMATSLLSPQLLSHRATAQVQCHRACIIKMAQCSSHRACIIVVMCTSWQAEVMAARREEAVDTALSLQPKRAALISETKVLQSQVHCGSDHTHNLCN